MTDEDREKPLTVGDVRKAIDGLPDDARVGLSLTLTDAGELTDVRLEGFIRKENCILVGVEVYEMDPYGDDEEEDDAQEEA